MGICAMQYFLLHCIKNRAMSVDTQTASSTYWMRVRGGYPKLIGLILRGDTNAAFDCRRTVKAAV